MEHYGYQYRNMIEQQVGAPIPLMDNKDEDEPLSEDMEAALSRLVAKAAVQLVQQNRAAMAQQQAQAQAQDPIIQMQMQELAIKGKDLERKVVKDQTDAQLKMQQQDIERERIAAQERQAQASLMSKSVTDESKMRVDMGKELMRISKKPPQGGSQ
jgi:hypothetical protein